MEKLVGDDASGHGGLCLGLQCLVLIIGPGGADAVLIQRAQIAASERARGRGESDVHEC